MNARLLLADVAAGVVMFAWGAFSHMALHLGGFGRQPLSEEAAVTAILKDKSGTRVCITIRTRTARPRWSAC
jgi:hypothetical protein